jgi:hypothetical protein
MLIHNVPQDNNNLHNGTYKIITYAVDEHGNYIKQQTSGWEPENIAHAMAWDDINRRVNEVKKNVLAGNLSPLAYFMEREMLNPKRLSGLIGISKWRIKWHMKPRHFKKISDTYLRRYSGFFNIPVSEFMYFKDDQH